mmetsp:Transcript_10075/g.15172  ORF Transcript_10075/g.15172 Transcript_10075/m.15172 type:complete len:179 (+) Transcript_10075:176-712(+)
MVTFFLDFLNIFNRNYISLEEALHFLERYKKCKNVNYQSRDFTFPSIKIVYGKSSNIELKESDLWFYCCTRHMIFDMRYFVYRYFSLNGYEVMPGMQYGVDFVLYRNSSKFHHSSFALLIKNKGLKLSWKYIKSLSRLIQNAKKKLMICTVVQSFQEKEDSENIGQDFLGSKFFKIFR